MTADTRKKVRGVLLAALMVASVFAVAAPATAAVSTADRTVADSTVAPGESTTVTVTATMDADGGSLTLNEAFSGEVASASIQSVTVDGSSASTVLEQAESGGAVVTLSSTGANAEVEITYEITAAQTGDITINGDVSGDGSMDLGSDTIAVEESNDGNDGNDGDNGDAENPLRD